MTRDPYFFTISSAALETCSRRSLLPSHWRDSGTCLCADGPSVPLAPAEIYRRVVGKRVLVARTQRGWSQQELADKAGLTRNYVSALERAAQVVDASRVRLVAAVLDLPLHELLAEPDGRGQ